MESTIHTPVMMQEAVEHLHMREGMVIVDATLGGGGYTRMIADIVGAQGRVIAIDADLDAHERFQVAFAAEYPQVELVHSNYGDLNDVLAARGIHKVDGIVADLGLSSDQLHNADTGLSFTSDVLDMRLDRQDGQMTAQMYLAEVSEDQLAQDLHLYGDERYARKIARAIVQHRDDNSPLTSAVALADLIVATVGGYYRNAQIHPATRSFQAIRIVVNDEFGHLERFLYHAVSALSLGAMMSVVSFHSGEDRIVKKIFKDLARDCICDVHAPICMCDNRASVKIIRPTPMKPSEEEVIHNPRSRSAKLRVIEKLI